MDRIPSPFRAFFNGRVVPWLALVTLLCGFALALFLAQPVRLVIACGQSEFDEPKVVQALVEALAQDRSGVRLSLLPTRGPAESAQALSSGAADLALVRSDIALDHGAASIIGLRKFFPVLFTSKGARIHKPGDLRGKRIGIGAQPLENLALATKVLSHWNLTEGDYSLVPLKSSEIAAAVKSGRIDAFFSVAAAGSRPAGRFIDVIRSVWGKDFVLIPFDDVSALVAKIPGVEAGEIPKGYFGGDPVRPDDDIDTIAISNRIVASSKVSTDTGATLTKVLLALRDKKQAQQPELLSISAPVRDNPTLPVHPGTAQILDGTYQGFVDRYTNQFYVGLAVLGGLGSLVSAYSRRYKERLKDQAVNDLHEILALGDRIERASDLTAVQLCLQRADELLKQTLVAAARGELASSQVAALQAAVARCHRAADLQTAFHARNNGLAMPQANTPL